MFLYPRRGFGAIAEALAERRTRRRAPRPPRLRRRPACASCADGGWRLDARRRHHARRRPGVVDRPAGGAGRAGRPAPRRPGAGRRRGRLRHRAMVLLYVVLDRPQWTEFDAHYFPGPEVLGGPAVRAPQLPRQPRRPARPHGAVRRDRRAGWATTSGRPPTATSPPAWRPSWRRPGCPGRAPASGREPPAARTSTPSTGPGFADDLAAARALGRPLAGLVTFGRQGLFTPDNTHHALAMGWAAADALAPTARLDAARWRAARDGFRSFVVED